MKKYFTNQAIERRRQQEISRDTDNFANLRPTTALEPTVSMRIDMIFNYVEGEDDSNLLMWSQGVVQLFSNGSNVPKDGAGFHKKRDVKVLWDANSQRNEEASTNVVSIPKSLFNKHVQKSWRLDLSL